MSLPVPQRLKVNYDKVKNISFIKSRSDPTENDVLELSEVLNDSLPRGEAEFAVSRLVRMTLVKANQEGYKMWTEHMKMPQALLWSDARTIVRHFRLGKKVHIKYNTESGHYDVSLHKSLLEAV